MTKYKVIPTISYKKTKPCCICFENKQHFISCSNPVCTDGIICFNCLKNMSPQQKNICQICRVPTNNFKKLNQILSLPKKKSTTSSKKCFRLLKNVKILLLSMLIPIIAYFLGIIIMYLFFDINIRHNMQVSNPFIIIIIGVLSIFLCLSCWCCFNHIINNLINSLINNRRHTIVYPSINTY